MRARLAMKDPFAVDPLDQPDRGKNWELHYPKPEEFPLKPSNPPLDFTKEQEFWKHSLNPKPQSPLKKPWEIPQEDFTIDLTEREYWRKNPSNDLLKKLGQKENKKSIE